MLIWIRTNTSQVWCIKHCKSMKSYNWTWTYMQTAATVPNGFLSLSFCHSVCSTFSILFLFTLPFHKRIRTKLSVASECFVFTFFFFNKHIRLVLVLVLKHRHISSMKIRYYYAHVPQRKLDTQGVDVLNLISWNNMEIEW